MYFFCFFNNQIIKFDIKKGKLQSLPIMLVISMDLKIFNSNSTDDNITLPKFQDVCMQNFVSCWIGIFWLNFIQAEFKVRKHVFCSHCYFSLIISLWFIQEGNKTTSSTLMNLCVCHSAHLQPYFSSHS